ncbi:SpoIIE family protein phosphatase [Streptomyces sp. RB6PN25]|uniref:SpoIIE family protein phosphatase n=1 Tax=Streptomyces humicola TaxID=2953240 RepID=A0ABT1PT60_9ACTN|nr:SpoIIE family protein phosphatase [Streptomyces humicola]MCQ4080863.1 SpoIIE family protein phosphatase [Streptomyces humicola]
MALALEDAAPAEGSDHMEDGWLTASSRERVLAGKPVEGGPRGAILSSWRRCQDLGLSPDRLDVPYEEDLELDSALVCAADPVLDRLGARIAGTWASVALADAQGRVLRRLVGERPLTGYLEALQTAAGFSLAERFVGTNAIGMALVERRPCHVFGHEHFVGNLHAEACVSVPITDPLSGRIVGVLDYSCSHTKMNPAMASLVHKAARAVEGRLLEQSSQREQALLQAYLHARQHPGIPGIPVRVDPDDFRVPPGSAVDSRDQDLLQEMAARMIAAGRKAVIEVPLSHGRQGTLVAQPVSDPFEGVVVEMFLPDGPPQAHDSVAASPAQGAVILPWRHALPEQGQAPEAASSRAGATTGETACPPGGVEEILHADTTRALIHRFPLMVGESSVGKFAVEARNRLQLLWEASLRIGTTLDVPRTAGELAETAVPAFADFVTVDLHDPVFRGEEPVAASAPMRRTAVRGIQEGCPFYAEHELVSFAPTTPQARCLVSGWPALEPDLKAAGGWSAQDPARAELILQQGVHSLIAVPVTARGVVLGVASFYRSATPTPFEDDDLLLAQELVTRAAVCIDNARRYTRERTTAVTLQRSLLPQGLTEQAALEIASRYLPASAQADVGGDWFDVIPLSGARVALIVGDVVGHGLQASVTMGRLRTAVRTLADIDLPPDELLTHLDDIVIRLSTEATIGADTETTGAIGATCLYAVYDPVSRRCTLARAGHPLPAVVTPDRGAEILDLPAGPPLGLGGLPFETAEVALPEDSLLALYTDGLIGSRERTIDESLDVLCHTLAQPAPSLDAICDTTLNALLPARANDDIALLLVRTHALGADQVATWDVPSDPAVVGRMRECASDQLAAWGLEEAAFTTELVVSELVTNAIRYGQPPIQLRLIHNRSLICEVSDGSSTAPHLRRARVFDEGGRGLLLVAQFTQRWGTRHTRHGKTIWAEQDLPIAN